MQQAAEEGAHVWGGGVQRGVDGGRKNGRKRKAKAKTVRAGCDGSKLNSQAVPTRIGLFFYSHHLNLVRKNLKSS